LQVRQAAQYAVDTAALAKAVFYDQVQPANQWSDKTHWAYNPAVVGFPYNPTKAKQLLSEAGYPDGLKTTIHYLQNAENDQLYTAIQGYFKVVGIDAALDPMLPARFDQLAYRGGSWDGFMWGTGSNTPDYIAALARYYSGQGGYYTQMVIPEDYAAAIKNASSATDFETKQKWAREANKLMVDKYCLQLFLYTPLNNAVCQPNVHDTGYFETINPSVYTPEDIWMDKK
jgi:peptide/nickel transport system substrate-binding protein